MRRIWAVAAKEWLHIVRDVRSLIAALSLPVLLLLLYGFAVSFDLNRLDFAVCDQDHSARSRELIANLAGLARFRFVGEVAHPDQAEPLFRRAVARGLVVVPAGFERQIERGQAAKVQVLIDGSEGTIASLSQAYLEGAVNSFGMHLSQGKALAAGLPPSLSQPPLEARVRYYYNPDLLSRRFLVPGLVAAIIMMLAALLTSGVVVRERERGTFELLAASPVAPRELIIGKLLPYLTMGILDVVLAVAIGWGVFGVRPAGSLLAILAVSAIFVLTASAIGLFFSCVSDSQQTAMTLALVTTVIPTMILSGFTFPVRNMPLLLQGLAATLPATHYISLLRGIILRGASLFMMWQEVAALLVIGVFWLALAINRFRKSM